MLTHMEESPFTPFQRVQFKTKLDAIQQECTSQVPNHTFAWWT